jgi:hypothetical protein
MIYAYLLDNFDKMKKMNSTDLIPVTLKSIDLIIWPFLHIESEHTNLNLFLYTCTYASEKN